MFDVAIPARAFLALRRNRIHVWSIQCEGARRAGVLRLIGQSLEQIGCARRAMMVENSPQRIDPFASLDGVQICRYPHELLLSFSSDFTAGSCQTARTERTKQLIGYPRVPARSALSDGLGKSFGRDIETLVSSRVSARPDCIVRRLECGTRQSRPWPSPSMGARIARSENLDKAPEGAGWEDSYASKARSDGRFAQTPLFTSLRPGADGDHHRHRAP